MSGRTAPRGTGIRANRRFRRSSLDKERLAGIAILRLDTDWYESTRHELATLYDRLSPGGVLIIDDYGTFQGARLAVEEFLEETGARLLLLPIGPGRIAVKP